MASVAEHKRRIVTRRGFQNDPYGSLSAMFDRPSMGGIDKAIAEAIAKVARNYFEDLCQDPAFIEAVARELTATLPQPKDGRDGVIGPRGIRGEKGDQGEPGIGIQGEQGTPGRDGRDGRDGTEIEGVLIVQKINALPIEPDQQIDAAHIKGLPNMVKQESVALHRGGVKLVWNVELGGTIDGVNATFTIPGNQPEPKDGRLVISARGVLKDTDSGDFTVTGRTITFAAAPPLGSSRPRAVIYHGK